MIDAVINCFKNQLPKYHGEIMVYNDIELEYAFFFKEVVYLDILSSPLVGRGLEFVMAVLEEATIYRFSSWNSVIWTSAEKTWKECH